MGDTKTITVLSGELRTVLHYIDLQRGPQFLPAALRCERGVIDDILAGKPVAPTHEATLMTFVRERLQP